VEFNGLFDCGSQGLNFDGYTFDDEENAPGSIQVRLIILAQCSLLGICFDEFQSGPPINKP
jgi:hypothetical protein